MSALDPYTPNLFGALKANPNVEDAVTGTLATWLPACLYEVERRNDLRAGSIRRPPTRHSIFADLDFDAWEEGMLPAVIATVNPVDNTELNSSGYGSWFEIEIAALVVDEDPNVARREAGWYGLAVAMAIAQHGSLGGIATVTTMLRAPVTEYPDPDTRPLVRSRTLFRSFIDGLVNPASGPKTATPPDSPQYPGTPSAPWADVPIVTSTPVTLQANPLD